MNKSKVYIIGAGPGSPDMLTLRAARCLARADIILYDRLVDRRILGLARPDAELIFVGKSPVQHSMRQEDINTLLIEHAMGGKCVARLKGGDPLVFGRGGEEAAALRKAKIPFEIVPGITTACALGAYAGIPLTHRGLAVSAVLATGHEAPDKDEEQVDWAALARAADTLAIYMGVRHLEHIAECLISAGLASDTPAAIVQNCASPLQRTLTGTLGEIARIARENRVEPPALTVIGPTVTLRETLNWFERLPLFGKRVLITRDTRQAASLSEQFAELGALPIEIPVLRIVPADDTAPLDRAIADLDRYDWVVFTSVNGVEAFMGRLRENGLDARALGRTRLCAIGPATAERLAKYFLRTNCVPARYVSAEIADAMQKIEPLRGKNILLPRADIAPLDLADRLRALGAEVANIAAYRTLAERFDAQDMLAQLREGAIDVVTLMSSSAARFFAEGLGAEHLKKIARSVAFAAIGPITAQTAREVGLPVDIEATEHTGAGLVRAVVKHYRK